MKNYILAILCLLSMHVTTMAQVTVTFQVDIENYLAEGNELGANGMRIGGLFYSTGATNQGYSMPDWTPSSPECAMTQIGSTTLWEIIVEFPDSSVGDNLLYKFVNNDWGTNEGGSQSLIVTGGCGTDDGGGNISRTLIIPNQNITVSYCYDWCTTCNGQTSLLEADNWISGRVFLDLNNNSTFEVGEPGVPNMNFTLQKSSGEISDLYSNIAGVYYGSGEDGINTLTINPTNQYISTNAPQNIPFTANPNEVTTINFPIQFNPDYSDIEMFAYVNQAVAGFSHYSNYQVRNNGTPAQNLTLTVNIPENFQFVSAQPEGTLNGNIYTWNISSISSFENLYFSIYSEIPPPPTFMPGDSVVFSGNVTTLPNEDNVLNNAFNYTVPILSSYDPNDKTMMNGRFLTPTQANSGNPFTYRIRFQNTGNFPASFIHVRDTLEAGFDASSIRLLSTSHEVAMSIENERYIDWYFPNIQLPDSTSDPEGSQGYILFTVNPILPLNIGDELENTAHIYFDYNPAVITNTEITTVAEPLGIKKTEDLNLSILQLNGQLKLIGDLSSLNLVQLLSVSGQVMQSWNTNFSEINISNHAAGIYFVKCMSNKAQKVFKVAVVK